MFGDAFNKLVTEELRWSIRRFSAQTGLSTSTFNRIKAMDSPRELYPSTVEKITAGLGWSTAEFNSWWAGVQYGDPVRRLRARMIDMRVSVEQLADATQRGFDAVGAALENPRIMSRELFEELRAALDRIGRERAEGTAKPKGDAGAGGKSKAG